MRRFLELRFLLHLRLCRGKLLLTRQGRYLCLVLPWCQSCNLQKGTTTFVLVMGNFQVC